MQNQRNDLSERLLEFAGNTIKLGARLGRTAAGRHVAGQLMRSGTSSGANYEEACGAESRPDFIHKLQIVLKELKESLYWLRLIQKASLIHPVDPNLSALLQEATELANIVAKSIVTARTPR
jgi:four helix bundle protein